VRGHRHRGPAHLHWYVSMSTHSSPCVLVMLGFSMPQCVVSSNTLTSKQGTVAYLARWGRTHAITTYPLTGEICSDHVVFTCFQRTCVDVNPVGRWPLPEDFHHTTDWYVCCLPLLYRFWHVFAASMLVYAN